MLDTFNGINSKHKPQIILLLSMNNLYNFTHMIPGVPEVFPKTRASLCLNRAYYHYYINGILLCMTILLTETLYWSGFVIFSTD